MFVASFPLDSRQANLLEGLVTNWFSERKSDWLLFGVLEATPPPPPAAIGENLHALARICRLASRAWYFFL